MSLLTSESQNVLKLARKNNIMKEKLFLSVALLVITILNVAGTEKLSSFERALRRGCFLNYQPSTGKLALKVDLSKRVVLQPSAARNAKKFTEVTFSLNSTSGEKVLEKTFQLKNGMLPEQVFNIQIQGKYTAVFQFNGKERNAKIIQPLIRDHFLWETAVLPDTSKEVFAPFTPVLADHNSAEVVLRQYKLNAFGLPDSILAGSPDSVQAGARPETLKKRELLASPAVISGSIAGKEITWKEKNIEKVSSNQKYAEWQSSVSSENLKIASHIRLEYDGTLKISMTLIPLKELLLDHLFIDIPLRAEESPFFHAVTDAIRINDAGMLPFKQGVVRNSVQARRGSEWQNTFVPYLYLGGPARGLAFFAENDKGWLTAKNDMKRPVQEIIREGEKVILRLHLCNTPSVLKKARILLFGLQAAPVKPLDSDWRARLRTDPGFSGPVNPWGGLHCASMGPYQERWDIVDDIIASQTGKNFSKEKFSEKIKLLNPPNVLGSNNYLARQLYFASRKDRPILVYHEENQASQIRHEWTVFQDEWGINNYTSREWPDENVLRRGFWVNPSSRVNFTESYIKYGLYYANQWLKRGIGLYWDNDYPTPSFNLRVSGSTYMAENGRIQPSVSFWNRREYHKSICPVSPMVRGDIAESFGKKLELGENDAVWRLSTRRHSLFIIMSLSSLTTLLCLWDQRINLSCRSGIQTR